MKAEQSQKRYRKFFPFQLDLHKSDELEIAEQIIELKRERSFSKTIRDGIRLICDLRKGRTDVLYELFPWVLEQQETPILEEQIEPISSAEQALRIQIERLENLILQQGALPIALGQKPSDVSVSSPTEDFELEIKTVANDENNNSTWNFMIASAINVFGNYDGLPDDIIEYGVRTGRINPDKLTRKPKPKPSGNPSKIANSDVSFAPPNFDDLDLTL